MMEPMRVEVGGVLTRVEFSPVVRWPDQGWLDRARGAGERAVFVLDGGLGGLEQTRLGELPAETVLVPGQGESIKTWTCVDAILARAMERGLGRDDAFVAVGGGAVCDTTGFAASVYQRGIALELVPTTLLCMVDASLGGKTGINFRGVKNSVGAFHPARAITMFLGALRSLPEHEMRSGMAEVVKAALLGHKGLWDTLWTQRDAVAQRVPEVMARIVRHSLELKARIVNQDPKETGVRAHLNLGHTFGHALESAAGPGTVTHGEAVAWGLDRALDLGVRMGQTDPEYRDRVRELLVSYGYRLRLRELAPQPAVTPERILAAMQQDKKKQGGRLRFVLQRSLGDTFLSADVPADLVTQVLTQET